MKLYARIDGETLELEVRPESGALRIRTGGREFRVALDEGLSAVRSASIDDRRLDFGWSRERGTYRIQIAGIEYEVEVRDARAEEAVRVSHRAVAGSGEVEVRAPIPGLIVQVLAAEGEEIRKDQPVMTLDAMKLENEIAAPRDGRIKTITVAPGTPVEKGQVLFVVS